jgi:hypothetical protein
MSGLLTGSLDSDWPIIQAALKECRGVKTCAAEKVGVSEKTIRRRVKQATEKYDLAHKVQAYEGQVKLLKKELKIAQDRTFVDKNVEAFLQHALSQELSPPEWVVRAGVPGSDHVAMSMLSDLHFAEVVNPRELMGLNAYDPKIAELRLRNYFEGAVRIQKEIMTGLKVRGMVMIWSGDMLSGDIHAELVETNGMASYPAVIKLTELLVAGIRMVADEVGAVHIVGVPGNHPRNSRKPRAKGYAINNLDWVLYHAVAQHFTGDARVTFAISDNTDIQVNVMGHIFHVTHGDQAKGGSGIAGMLSPLMLLDHRKRKWASQTGNAFDYLTVGHWHQFAQVFGVIINGSLKGYDEYCMSKNFAYQAPQQGFWMVHPKRGVVYTTPIFVEDPDEGWRDQVDDWQPKTFIPARQSDTPPWLI